MKHELTILDFEALNDLLVRGKTYSQIHEELGITPARLRYLLSREDVKAMVSEVRARVESELENMGSLVMSELRNELKHPDPRIRQTAVDKWLKAMGYYSRDIRALSATAEDIARILLNSGKKEGE